MSVVVIPEARLKDQAGFFLALNEISVVLYKITKKICGRQKTIVYVIVQINMAYGDDTHG